jgi:hypothetical protein
VIVADINPGRRGNKTVDATLDSVALAAASIAVDPKHNQAEVRIVDDTYNDSPPAVALTSPPDGSTYALPATILITAEASDLEDVIQKVSFYQDDNFLGSATATPFTFNWVNPKAGDYALFARAVDSAGKSTLSQAVRVKVTGVVPTIAITSPLDGATVDPLSDLPITVQPTGNGDLTVRLSYDTSHVLGEVKKAPYTFTWRSVPAGKHTLTARVTDAQGQTATASIQITAVDLPPNVQISSPIGGASFTEGTDITLQAKATDPDDGIKDVTFWVNHRVLGKGTVSGTDPSLYQLNWSSPDANFYLIQAVATNSNGTKKTSDAVYVTVSKKP